ncbi:Phosducin-like protein [Exaiptasia diaphana]|nr:Phosducin-like protein [Exaiptasia diaphana]
MTSIEDKILGYKAQNYVSSSESEEEGETESHTDSNEQASGGAAPDVENLCFTTGAKTGPKGVLQDFRRYKQLETQQKQEQEEELKSLIKKFSTGCQTSIDDEKEKALMKELEIEEDEFLKQYHFKRLLQMKEEQDRKIAETRPKFGHVIEITDTDAFLMEIDKELLHDIPSCICMNTCLDSLSQQYPMVKFCRVKATITGISANFRENGLPALLVYKGEQLVGNFVQLENAFGDNFDSSDVESFLIQNHILTDDINCEPSTIAQHNEDHEDSDLDLD